MSWGESKIKKKEEELYSIISSICVSEMSGYGFTTGKRKRRFYSFIIFKIK